MAFRSDISNFTENEVLTKERLNELVAALNELGAHLKVYDEVFSGNLNVTGALKRAGYTVYDEGHKPTPAEVGAIPLTGSSAVSGSLSPNNANCDLGTSAMRWRNVYGTNIQGGNVYDNGARVYSPVNKPTASDVGAIPLSGSSSISGSLSPSGTRNLGSSSQKWNYVYANYFKQGGNSVLSQISYSRTGYMKFSNNLKICWGKFDVGGNSRIDFPSSFYYVPYVVACEGNQNKLDYNMNVTNITTSSFVIRKGNGGDRCYGCYIAIGQ